jgi:hypothetical protein
VINKYSQATNSSILKNLCQTKQEKHMNKKIITITLVQHLWLANSQVRIDQVQLLILNIYESNLIIRRRFSKNKSIKDMK